MRNKKASICSLSILGEHIAIYLKTLLGVRPIKRIEQNNMRIRHNYLLYIPFN